MGRQGSTTVLVLLVGAALMMIATATWRRAEGTLVDARAAADVLQARLAAEAGVRRHVRSSVIPPSGVVGVRQALQATMLVPPTGPGPAVSADRAVLRVSRELFRLESVGRAGRPGALASVGYLLWMLDPTARLTALGAVATANTAVTVLPGGKLTADSVTAPPHPWTGSVCATVQSQADSVFPTGRTVPAASDTTPAIELGQLGPADLFLMGRSVSPPGSPQATTIGGVCDTADPWNWGSPLAPSGPCGGHRPLTVVHGDLHMTGGQGQGVLVVAGDLRLGGGSRFHGLVLVAGDLSVDNGSRIDGFVRAGGAAFIGVGGHVSGSACAVLLALSNPVFRETLPVRSGWLDPM